VNQFIEQYDKLNKPVIIRGVTDKWLASGNIKGQEYRKWTIENLVKRFGDTRFKVDELDPVRDKKLKMKLRHFVHYMRYNEDEDPIYLFDANFGDREPQLLEEYEVPKYFKEDFFELLGDHDRRPPHQWLVMGSSRSGSPFHIDPYKTAAWNALLQGRKRWFLYPPGVIPPGVDNDSESEEEDYDAPEPFVWLTENYPFLDTSKKPFECVQQAGEIIFVPSGWWHATFNLEDCVAVTQNFVNSQNFNFVYPAIKKSRKLHKIFKEIVLPKRPDLFRVYGEFEEQPNSIDAEKSKPKTLEELEKSDASK